MTGVLMNNRPVFMGGILFCLWCMTTLVWAGRIDESKHRIETVNRKNKKPRSYIDGSIKENILHKGIFDLRIHGKGDYAGYKDVVWISESQIKEGLDSIAVLKSSTKVFLMDKIIFQSEKNYNYTTKIATIELVNVKNKRTIRKKFPIRGPICDDVTLVYVFNKIIPLNNRPYIPRFYLLTDEPKLYHVMVTQRTDEILRFSSGPREAEKFQLRADLGPLTEPASKIVPPTYIWFPKDDQRHWLQYEGLETGYKTANILAYKVEDHLKSLSP